MFTWSPWIITSFFIAIIAWGLHTLIMDDAKRYGREIRQAKAERNKYISGLIAVYLALCLFGSWVIGADHGPSKAYAASNDQVAKDLFGFTPGEPYNLQLSGQVTTFNADLNASVGFFSSDASATVSGGPAITVSFTHDNIEYVLTLPRDKTLLVNDNSPSPSMIIRFRPDLHTTNANYDRTWSKCHFAFSNLLPACKRIATINDHATAPQVVINQGLGQLVADSFESAELRLPKGMRDQLLGTIG